MPTLGQYNRLEAKGWGSKSHSSLKLPGNGDSPTLGQASLPDEERNLAKRGKKKQPERHPLSKELRLLVLQRDRYCCQQCGAASLLDKKVRLEIDHIVPVSRGGSNDPANLQVLCRSCNQAKRARLV